MPYNFFQCGNHSGRSLPLFFILMISLPEFCVEWQRLKGVQRLQKIDFRLAWDSVLDFWQIVCLQVFSAGSDVFISDWNFFLQLGIAKRKKRDQFILNRIALCKFKWCIFGSPFLSFSFIAVIYFLLTFLLSVNVRCHCYCYLLCRCSSHFKQKIFVNYCSRET